MEQAQRSYLPAAGRHWMLPLYDPLVKLIGGNTARRALLDHALIQAGHRGPRPVDAGGSFAASIHH